MLDVCDYLAYCLDDPETSSVILFVEGFKRPERFLALADRALHLGKPIMAVKVGRSDQAQAAAMAHSGSLAGEARVTDAALDAAGVIRCRDLDELLETAELVEGVRRTGRRVGRGRAGVVTVSTGEASLIADLVPRTGLDLPPIPPSARAGILEALPTMGYIGNPLDPWGAADPATAYGAVFEAMAASEAYDVLVLVHDFPYRSLPSEVATANEVTSALLDATADRPAILPVYVSLTSGEPPPETKALLDSSGNGAPLLRGTLESFRAIAEVARWERRHADRQQRGPWRPRWAALAADRTSYGADPARDPALDTTAGRPLRAREPGDGRGGRRRRRRDGRGRRCRCRGGGRATDRGARRDQAGRGGPDPQDRSRRRGARAARRRCRVRGRAQPAGDRATPRPHRPRPAGRADGPAGRGAHPRPPA